MPLAQTKKALKLLKTSVSQLSGIREDDFDFAYAYFIPVATVSIRERFDYLELRFNEQFDSWTLMVIRDRLKEKYDTYSFETDDITDISLEDVREKIRDAITDGYAFW